MDCPHSGKLFDNGFVLSVAIRIGVTDLVMISYTLELIIRQGQKAPGDLDGGSFVPRLGRDSLVRVVRG